MNMMSTPKKNPDDVPLKDADLYLAFRLMKRKDFDGAEARIMVGLKLARQAGQKNLEGVYFSAFGVLYKLKKDYKKSYKYYQLAEKLLPDDHSLKVITAVLLIEEFAQYDTAIRKLAKVIEASANDPAMMHHAKAVQGLAYFLMGKKDQASLCLDFLLTQDFQMLRSAANVDFKMVEVFIKKGFQLEKCKTYLERALQLAKKKNEKVYLAVIETLLEFFDKVV
jgi:tetratricopeptide (TPR) repeat protein